MIYYDVETTGLQPDYHRAFMYQFADDESDVEVLVPGEDDERIQHWFNRATTEGIMCHNSKFDWSFGEAAGFTLPPEDKWFDSMLIAHAIDERRSVALKSVSTGLFGPDADDLQRDVKAWLTAERGRRKTAAREAGEELVEPNYSDVPADLMREYAAEDVVLTRKVNKVYRPILAKAPEIANIVEFEREVMGALYAMERRGFPADVAAYRGLEHELVESLEEIEENIQSLAKVPEGEEFNPASSPQLYAALDRLGADLSFVTNESMDKENLHTVDHPLARAVETFRSEYKVLGTYVQPMISRSYDTSMRSWKEPFVTPDGRIHANYRQVGARTGRMSCCIAAGTLIDGPRDLRANPDGVPIEDVKVGDTVYSFDEAGVPRPRKVLETFDNGVRPVVKLVYRRRGRGSSVGYLKLTPDHRVALENGTYLRADALSPGDKLGFLGRATVRSSRGGIYSRVSWAGCGHSVPEHRHLVTAGELVHHIDENPLNNSLDNLEGLTKAEHGRRHNADGVNPGWIKPCPYERGALEAILSDGIKSAVARSPHDFATLHRWAGEAGIEIADKRVLHPVLPLDPDDFLDFWEEVGVRAVMDEFGCGTYTAYKWYNEASAAPVVNHEVVEVVNEGESLPTHDLTVEGTHNFVANEVWAENSTPNLQNQPRDDLRLRYNLRADPGMKLVTCDLSNIEMRVFAAYTGEGKLLDAFREGRDVYTDVAENLGIRDRERAGGHIETARQRAKMFALSVIYGGGLRTIRKQQRCDMNQARMLQRRFYEAYPEASRLQDRILWRLEDRGYVTSAWGRRFRSDNPDREGYKFTNYIVQGTAADLLKASLVRVHKEGIPIVACVHDELLAHVPEADAEEAKDKMIEALTDHPRISDKVPLTADGDIVDRWSQSKDVNFVPKWARDAA